VRWENLKNADSRYVCDVFAFLLAEAVVLWVWNFIVCICPRGSDLKAASSHTRLVDEPPDYLLRRYVEWIGFHVFLLAPCKLNNRAESVPDVQAAASHALLWRPDGQCA
jgi:hypothetical protein